MASTRITSKGRVTIPVAVRQRLGLNVGDQIVFVELENGVFTIKPTIGDVRSLKGLLRKPANPIAAEDMNTAIRMRDADPRQTSRKLK